MFRHVPNALTAGRLLLFMLCLPILGGCERFIYEYRYNGRLAGADGSPIRSVEKVSVDGAAPYKYEDVNGRVFDSRDENLAVLDATGNFSGSLRVGTYLQWVFFPTPPAPPLREVLIWYSFSDRWRLIPEKLDDASQKEISPGQRVIHLGTVLIPER